MSKESPPQGEAPSGISSFGAAFCDSSFETASTFRPYSGGSDGALFSRGFLRHTAVLRLRQLGRVPEVCCICGQAAAVRFPHPHLFFLYEFAFPGGSRARLVCPAHEDACVLFFLGARAAWQSNALFVCFCFLEKHF